jgi:lipoyl(octanoyl) transferase
MPMPECHYRSLGRVGYEEAARLQEELVNRRRRGEIPDQLLLLEHPHVLTKGSRAREEHILVDAAARDSLGLTVHESGRGGDVTYHGPGQLVGYPILQLQKEEQDAHRYLRQLEEVLIRVLERLGIPAQRHPCYTGVWVGDAKVAAIGVRLSRWVTSHGFALNVNCDLSYFDTIVPCGIQGKRVSSLRDLGLASLNLEQVTPDLVSQFGTVFQRQMVAKEN